MNIRKIKSFEDLQEVIKSGEVKSVSTAVKLKCLDCCCYELSEVKKCTSVSCPLYQFRDGVYKSEK